MRDVVIVSAVRTPIGSFGGSLKDVTAVKLGAFAAKGALDRANVKPEMVEEVIFGNILQAGIGQNLARQISIAIGVRVEVPSVTINKVCGSGLKTVQLAAQAIMCNEADIILAGGAENMSLAPYIIPNARWGLRMGDGVLVDSMVADGLTDVFNKYPARPVIYVSLYISTGSSPPVKPTTKAHTGATQRIEYPLYAKNINRTNPKIIPNIRIPPSFFYKGTAFCTLRYIKMRSSRNQLLALSR